MHLLFFACEAMEKKWKGDWEMSYIEGCWQWKVKEKEKEKVLMFTAHHILDWDPLDSLLLFCSLFKILIPERFTKTLIILALLFF